MAVVLVASGILFTPPTRAAVIDVPAGADGLAAAFAKARPGDTLLIDKPVELKGLPGAVVDGDGSSFSPGGADGHLIEPASGRPALSVASVTVRAPTATLADGLSTAIAVAGPQKAGTILSRFPGTAAFLQSRDGTGMEL